MRGALGAVAADFNMADAERAVVKQPRERDDAAGGRVGNLHAQCAEILHSGGLRGDATGGEQRGKDGSGLHFQAALVGLGLG